MAESEDWTDSEWAKHPTLVNAQRGNIFERLHPWRLQEITGSDELLAMAYPPISLGKQSLEDELEAA